MGAKKPLLEERCHEVTERWQMRYNKSRGRHVDVPCKITVGATIGRPFEENTKRATHDRPYESHSLKEWWQKNKRRNTMKREDISIRDPFILPYEDKYYLYGSRGSEVWDDNATGLDVYVSDDLENWSEPKEIFTRTADFWADRHYTAAEVYAYNGAFYMFASFKSADRCRGNYGIKGRQAGRQIYGTQ